MLLKITFNLIYMYIIFGTMYIVLLQCYDLIEEIYIYIYKSGIFFPHFIDFSFLMVVLKSLVRVYEKEWCH